MKKIKVAMLNIGVMVALVFLCWITISFIEINIKNDCYHPLYNEHNFFIVMNEITNS